MPFVRLVAEFKPVMHAPGEPEGGYTMEIVYPSSTVKEYFKKDDQIAAIDFLAKAIKAMKQSNRKVMEQYGFQCSGCQQYEQQLERMLLRREMKATMVLVKHVDG